MASPPKDPTRLREMARRLRITRLAFGYTQATMSGLAGAASGGQAWENYESGRRLISIHQAMTLCQRLGLSLDWIYFGSLRHLPSDVRRKIERALATEQQPVRRANNNNHSKGR